MAGLWTMEQLERKASGEMGRTVRHQFRHGASRRVHVVRREPIIVSWPQRRVIVGRTVRETVIVLDAVAGDILENLQISCEVGDNFNKARRRHGSLPVAVNCQDNRRRSASY